MASQIKQTDSLSLLSLLLATLMITPGCSDDSSSPIDSGVDGPVTDISLRDGPPTDGPQADSDQQDLRSDVALDAAAPTYPRPVAYWTFDNADVTGDTAKNVAGSGRAGTIVGAVAGGEGKSKQGISFDGDSDYVDFGDVLDPVFAGADKTFSIAFWIKPAALGTTQALLTKNADSACMPSEAQRMFHSALLDDGVATFTYQTPQGGNPKLQKSTNRVTAGSWSHLLITYDGRIDTKPEDRVVLYLNGQKETIVAAKLGTFPFDLSDGTAHLAFGARLSSSGTPCVGGGAGYYRGLLDELAIWDVVLSDSAAQAVYAQGTAGATL
jgi:hypothetical protein